MLLWKVVTHPLRVTSVFWRSLQSVMHLFLQSTFEVCWNTLVFRSLFKVFFRLLTWMRNIFNLMIVNPPDVAGFTDSRKALFSLETWSSSSKLLVQRVFTLSLHSKVASLELTSAAFWLTVLPFDTASRNDCLIWALFVFQMEAVSSDKALHSHFICSILQPAVAPLPSLLFC